MKSHITHISIDQWDDISVRALSSDWDVLYPEGAMVITVGTGNENVAIRMTLKQAQYLAEILAEQLVSRED